ncbi:MAG TPA: flagellar basal body P-ring formation chaperone FlgA [Candidatus Hydrogenedentes bacterium]|nr:flagellar basal body P-ring formation chaperone FlgA [Candidatus Hydrogenedentota bacterium]
MNGCRQCVGLVRVVVAACLLGSLAAAADTIVLRDEAYVKGPNVVLGDVAEVQGEYAAVLEQVEVASAALPGDSCRLNASIVEARVKRAGVPCESLDFQGARAVSATTLSQHVSPDDVALSLRTFIEVNMPWSPNDAVVDVQPPQQDYVVPEGVMDIVWRPSPEYQYLGSGAFRGDLLVDGALTKSVTCRVHVEPYAEVLVARSDIPRGTPLTTRVMQVEKRSLLTLKGGVFQDVEALDGYVAKTTIFPGQVITDRNVTAQVLIRRRQLVPVAAQVGGLEIQGRARACSDGCVGDVVLCENLDSKQQFQGIVRKDGVVLVP